MLTESVRWVYAFIVFALLVGFVVSLLRALWRNEPARDGTTPRVFLAASVAFAAPVVLLVLWLGGAFETPRERCARLASRAYPLGASHSASDQREWNRYFYRCLAENRNAGIEVD